MRLQHSLLLYHEDFRRKTIALFEALNSDPQIRQAFIDNPTESIALMVLPPEFHDIAPQRVSAANRLLFSALANERFLSWAAEYQRNLIAELRASGQTKADMNKIAQDVAQAILDHGDRAIVLSLLSQERNIAGREASAPPQSVAVLIDDVAIGVHVYLIFKFITYVDFLVVLDPQEDFDVRLNPAQLRAISEQAVENARRLSESGDLLDLRTRFD